VVLATGCNSWHRGLDVVVEGEARFYNHGADDWPSEVFSVAPAKVFAHAKGEPYGATTHRF
jgi:hypothetical protein